MKPIQLASRTAVSIALILLSASVSAQAPPPPRPTVPPVKPKVTPIQPPCRDPAAVYLMSQVVFQRQDAGQIQLTGQVVNRGNAAFVSPPQQARVKILESRPQGGAPIILADKPLDNLPAGHALGIQVRRAWTRNVQFPPTFSLILSYDPDILHDGNPENDDCNMSNNQIDLQGAIIDHEWPNQVLGRPR